MSEQVDVEAARLEYPGSLAPVVVNREQVVEFRDGGAHSRERVVLGTAQVGVSFEENRVVIVGIESVMVGGILTGVGAPVEYSAELASGGEAGACKRALHASVEVKSQFVDDEIPVLRGDFAARADDEAFGKCSWAVQVGIRVLVVDVQTVSLA